jgi:Cu(I)/Ag(I) efflux system membrane fusion protein/cobalt-zinc-cadmium efflux system membrane fusion protein
MKNVIKFTAIGLAALAIVFFAFCKGQTGAQAPAPGAAQAKPESGQPAPKKRTMYKSTMMPNEVSDKPGKDSMGMDMVPFEVEEGGPVIEVGGRIRVRISAQRQQLIGIKTALVAAREIHRLIRAVGQVDYAEPSLSYVNLKYDGWVEKLYVASTGRSVRKGEPLFDLYSPDVAAAQQEYLIALKAGAAFGDAPSVLRSARDKLRLWDLTDAQIEELGKTGEIKKTLTVYAPGSGIVVEKDVVQGQKVMAGENLYKIADLSRVWILGEVYEYELPFIKPGQEVLASLSYDPGQVFTGKISYIYPYLKPETRTNQIRIEAANPGLKLKPRMFANLEIHVNYGLRLTVPAEAVVDAGGGTRIVFAALGDGYFEPREVKLGVRGEDLYEVLGGVSENEAIVTSANFLVDSESSLKAALAQMTKAAAGEHDHD